MLASMIVSSQETIRSSTNAMHDSCVSERMALEWTHKYISRFGGDPEKVIMRVRYLFFYLFVIAYHPTTLYQPWPKCWSDVCWNADACEWR
jgi:hypothetical protein